VTRTSRACRAHRSHGCSPSAQVGQVNNKFKRGSGVESFPVGDILPVPTDSLDAVICNMNYHDMVGRGYDTAKINAAVFNALKPGGIYGIIDNSAAPGSGARDVSTLHRIDEAYEVNQIKGAGFVLQAASDALRNPKDDRTWLVFQHRGEQDRFMLKFVKPQGAGGVGAKSPK
jgi:predicted methyltransferase